MQRKSVSRISMMATPIMIVCGMLLTGSSAWAKDDHDIKWCSNRTLQGDYGFTIEGVGGLPPAFPLNAIRGVAMGHFDGKGNYSQVDHVVAGGVPPPLEWTPGSGPYTVNPDCTGTLVINIPGSPFSPVNLHFVVVRQGKEIRTVVDSGSATTSTGIKVGQSSDALVSGADDAEAARAAARLLPGRTTPRSHDAGAGPAAPSGGRVERWRRVALRPGR